MQPNSKQGQGQETGARWGRKLKALAIGRDWPVPQSGTVDIRPLRCLMVVDNPRNSPVMMQQHSQGVVLNYFANMLEAVTL